MASFSTSSREAAFAKIQAETGTAFVMVTRDESMTAVANRIIELKDGEIIRDERIE